MHQTDVCVQLWWKLTTTTFVLYLVLGRMPCAERLVIMSYGTTRPADADLWEYLRAGAVCPFRAGQGPSGDAPVIMDLSCPKQKRSGVALRGRYLNLLTQHAGSSEAKCIRVHIAVVLIAGWKRCTPLPLADFRNRLGKTWGTTLRIERGLTLWLLFL